MNEQEKYMQQCISLAEKALGSVAPNPLVGAMLVHGGRIIGEGFHEKYGEAHAEVNCLKSVKLEDQHLIPDATMYVNLEPCSHHGKTPPCADLIIANKIKKVIVGCLDPNLLVAGKGIQKLEEAGILVETHVLELAAKKINRRFFVYHEQKRPYIILKWAISVEGNFCPNDKSTFWLSNAESKKIAHQWRSEEDAIMIGSGTALADNPSLTVREWSGRNPIRILLDRNLKTPLDYHIYNDEAKTIVFNLHKNDERAHVKFIQLAPQHFIKDALQKMYEMEIQSVMIEGGLEILNECMSMNLWDEIRVIQSNTSLEEGLKAPIIQTKAIHHLKLQEDIIYYHQFEARL